MIYDIKTAIFANDEAQIKFIKNQIAGVMISNPSAIDTVMVAMSYMLVAMKHGFKSSGDLEAFLKLHPKVRLVVDNGEQVNE